MLIRGLVGMLVSAVAFSSAWAASNAFDSAADPAYASGWTNGSNGGSGFGPWTITTNPPGTTSAGSFIGDSTTLSPGNSGGNINTSGVSFGLFGYNDAYANAIRAFNAPLSVGQTFSIQIAVNYRNGNKGFDITDPNGNNIFDLNIGGDDYSVNNTGGGTTNLFDKTYDPNTVFTVYITQTTPTEGSWTIVRSGGMSGTASSGGFPYQGLAAGINIYNVQTTDGNLPQDYLFANNMQIVPEPSTMTLLAVASLLGLFCYVHRRRELAMKAPR
jgi:hypothetical protein